MGSFTVHEADYSDGQLRRFSATYLQRCLGSAGWSTGSIAWNATDPALPVPAAPAAEVRTPAPVENLTADAGIGNVAFHWDYPEDPDAQEAVFCGRPGKTPLPAPTLWCLQNSHCTTGRAQAMFPPHQDYAWSAWALDAFGNLGPARNVLTQGSVTTLSTVPSSQGAVTNLSLAGHLVDASSGKALGGRPVEIYLGRRYGYDSSGAEVASYSKYVTTLTSGADGTFARTFPLHPGLSYQARFQGGGTRMGNLSTLVPADGSTYIDFDTEDLSGARSRKIQLVARTGVVHRGDRVIFQRMRKGHWRKVAVRNVTSGRAVMRTRVAPRTGATFRAVLSTPGRGSHTSFPVRVRRR